MDDEPEMRFGRLIRVSAITRGRAVFRCDCGAEKEIAVGSVRRGATKSCGCLHLERCRSGINQTRHGDARVSGVAALHKVWRSMLARCNPTHATPHPNYAGRGIGVCDEWHDYRHFKAWAVDAGYRSGLTIERIDNDGDYGPHNCRWATRTEQARNRRTTRYLSIDGANLPVASWLEIVDVTRSAYYGRISRGWSPARALGLNHWELRP